MKINKIKNLSISIILLSSGIAQAQGPTSNIDVKAKINSGCQVTASDISFGNVEAMYEIVDASMNIRCSKNVVADITGGDKNNPGGYWGPRLWRVGESQDKPETRIRYAVSTYAVASNENIQVVKLPSVNYLWFFKAGAGNDYNLIIKFLNGENAIVPFKGIIEGTSAGITQSSPTKPFNKMELIPGDYSDEFTYTVTF